MEGITRSSSRAATTVAIRRAAPCAVAPPAPFAPITVASRPLLPRTVPRLVHQQQPLATPPLLGGSACAVVVAAADSTASELELVRFLFPAECEIVVFDKSASPCTFMPLTGISSCLGLPNVGREQHSYLHYVRSNYDALPEYIFFVPSALSKHSRMRGVQTMLNESTSLYDSHPHVVHHLARDVNPSGAAVSLRSDLRLGAPRRIRRRRGVVHQPNGSMRWLHATADFRVQ